jgi:hypothetical protein
VTFHCNVRRLFRLVSVVRLLIHNQSLMRTATRGHARSRLRDTTSTGLCAGKSHSQTPEPELSHMSGNDDFYLPFGLNDRMLPDSTTPSPSLTSGYLPTNQESPRRQGPAIGEIVGGYNPWGNQFGLGPIQYVLPGSPSQYTCGLCQFQASPGPRWSCDSRFPNSTRPHNL